jgi:hypothetical protein
MCPKSSSVPDPEDEPTIDVPRAGRCIGLSRSSAYEAARRGEIPTFKCGKRILVPTAAFRRLLGLDGH